MTQTRIQITRKATKQAAVELDLRAPSGRALPF